MLPNAKQARRCSEHRPSPRPEPLLRKAQTMQLDTTIRSPGALALGVFFAGVTARTIFDDVFTGAPVTIAHLNALAALVAAVAAGHYVLPTFKEGRYPAALGLAAIFVGATAYVVTSSGARNAEVASEKAAAIVKTNEERDALKAKLAAAESDVDRAKAELEAGKASTAADVAKAAADFEAAKREAASECASGKAKRCEGREATRDAAKADLEAVERRGAVRRAELAKAAELAESHAGMMRGRIALLGPEAKPFEGYHQAARVFEAAGLGAADVIEARLELLMPFALVLITELSTVVFSSMALGRRERVAPLALQTEAASEPSGGSGHDTAGQSDLEAIPEREAFEVATLLDTAGRSGKPRGGGRAVPKSRPALTKGDALDDVMHRLADGQTIPSQAALADDWGRPETTVSDWMREWRRLGIIPQAVQAGRCKATPAG